MSRFRVKYIPFFYKVLVFYLILVMLAVIVVGYFSYQTALKSRIELIESNINWTMEQLQDNIEYKVNEVASVSDALFSSMPFQKYLQTTAEPELIHTVTAKNLIPIMETALQRSMQNMRLVVYTKNNRLPEVYGSLDSKIIDKSYHIVSYERLQNKLWHMRLQENEEDNVWAQVEQDIELGNISLLRKLISFEDYYSDIGFIRLSVPLETIFSSIAEENVIAEDTVVRIIDPRNQHLLFQTGPIDGVKLNDLTFKKEIRGTPFMIETHISKAVLSKDTRQIGQITLLVCSISFIVIACIGVFIARFTGRRMLDILRSVRAFQYGNFERRIAITGQDEYAQLSHAFNHMAEHIEALIKEVYVKDVQKKAMELDALQAQINPHFLYNTLSSISSLANIGEIEKLTAMVTSLTRFYRLVLNDGDVIISLKDEIDQVKAYLNIQQIKYGGRFTVSYTIDEDVLNYRVIKLMIQPFIENIFKHAWFDDHIHIRIIAQHEAELLVIKVIDDGIGMTPDTVSCIFQTDAIDGSGGFVAIDDSSEKDSNGSNTGYGIRNVNDRIKLYYGEQYGVHLYSRLGIGTTVKICMPKVNDEKGGVPYVLSDFTR